MITDLIRLLVPTDILEHFDYEQYEETQGIIQIYLVEKKDSAHCPKAIAGKPDHSLNGYMNPVELQTFPIKGKEVFLVLKRRRWKLSGSDKSYFNEYDFYEEGMKATKEFGAFLKEIGRG